MKIEIFSDTVCPWCRIGKHNLFTALAQWPEGRSIEINWRAFLLDSTVPPEGLPFRETMQRKFGASVPMDQLFGQVTRAGEAVGLTFDFGRIQVMPDTRLSQRLVKLVPEDRRTALMDAIMNAYFVEGENIGDSAVLLRIAGGLGFDETALKQRLEDGEGQAQVEEDLRYAARAGIRGVPYFVFDGKYALTGAQPAQTFLQVFEKLS